MRRQARRAAVVEADVERQHDAVGTELAHPLLDLRGLRHRHAADDDALHAEAEQFAGHLARADAAADLDGCVRERLRQAGDGRPVALRAIARAVEVDDVHVAGAEVAVALPGSARGSLP